MTDGKPEDRIVGLYEENAAAFDAQRSRALFERPWLEAFAARLPPGGTVLDVGCGMAEPMAAWLIGRGFRLTGIDSSPAMIAMCRARFPDHEWRVEDMRRLALGRRFDGVLAWHSSFHLTREDQRALIPRLAAHIAPGGHLMFTSGDEDGVSIGRWQGEPLYHASLDAAEYRALLEANGFTVPDRPLRGGEPGDATAWLARRDR
ncbi:MAG: class I SAM-dependent DNA methyltransferase [Allosphingosinicella sp.]